MYKYTKQSLKKRNEEIDHKIPTIEESIKTYSQMAQNYKNELDSLIEERFQNNKVIEMLNSNIDDGKGV